MLLYYHNMEFCVIFLTKPLVFCSIVLITWSNCRPKLGYLKHHRSEALGEQAKMQCAVLRTILRALGRAIWLLFQYIPDHDNSFFLPVGYYSS